MMLDTSQPPVNTLRNSAFEAGQMCTIAGEREALPHIIIGIPIVVEIRILIGDVRTAVLPVLVEPSVRFRIVLGVGKRVGALEASRGARPSREATESSRCRWPDWHC